MMRKQKREIAHFRFGQHIALHCSIGNRNHLIIGQPASKAGVIIQHPRLSSHRCTALKNFADIAIDRSDFWRIANVILATTAKAKDRKQIEAIIHRTANTFEKQHLQTATRTAVAEWAHLVRHHFENHRFSQNAIALLA